jgi:integrase
VDPPKRRPKPINSLTAEGLTALNTKLSELEGNPVAIAARLALLTGMRQGEICALRWVDVDLSDRSLHVEHAASAEKALKQIVMGV